MDCDDDDITRRNLPLAGESRTRSSPALRPYDFPKFDFDDNLQGHLRFDSLVETEVFLGIKSQDDNNWIEDFSRVSNGMEFNPNPADSCSISRRDNVWSEATSSESVEMLLKSVGQEELTPATSIMPGTNASDGLGTLIQHVEPGLEVDERHNLCVADVDAKSMEDKVKDHTSPEGCMEEKWSIVEGPPLTPENVRSSCEDSCNLTKDVLCGMDGMSTMDGTHSSHDKPFDEKLEEQKTSVEKNINCEAAGDSVCFMDISYSDCSRIETLNTSGALQQVGASVQHVSCDSDRQELYVSTGKELVTVVSEVNVGEGSVSISTLCATPCLVTDLGVVSQDADGAAVECAKDSTKISVEDKPKVKFSERDDKNAPLRTVQTDEGVVSNEMEDPSTLDGSNPHSPELGSFHTGYSSSLEQKADSSTQLTGRHDFGNIENVLTNHNQRKIVPETTLLLVDNSLEKSSPAALLSLNAENKQNEMVDICRNECVAVQEEPGADLPGHFKSNSGQVVEENLSHSQPDLSAKKRPIGEINEEDTELPGGNVNSEEAGALVCDQGTKSLGVTEEVKNNEDRELQNQTDEGMESARKQPIGEINEEDTELPGGNVNSEEAGALVCDQRTQSLGVTEGVLSNENCELQNQTYEGMESVNDVAAHATSNTSFGLDDDTENGHRKSAVVGLCHSDVHENDAERKSSDQHLRTEVGGFSEVEVCGDDDSACSPCEVAAKPHKSLDELTNVRSSRSQSIQTDNSLHLDNPVVHLRCKKSSLKGSSDAEVAIMKSEGIQELAHVTEVDKASCGSPTIISSSEPCQIVKDAGEETRGSGVIETSVRDCQPTSEDIIGKDMSADDSSFTFKVNALPDTTSESMKSWSPFPDVGKCNSSNLVMGSTPSVKDELDMTSSPESTRQSALIADVEQLQGTPKGISERKGRRASGRGTTKESAKKGSQAKGANQDSSTGKVEKGSDVLLNTPNSSSLAQYRQSQSYKNLESSDTKLGVPTVPMLNLSDLNASTLNKINSSSSSYRQPFSDLQQVQLRAQIFVYGSLIQGTAPDEACMVSAFGPSGAGRTTWEPVWRSAVERVRDQKSSSSAAETPLPSHSGARISNAAAKQSSNSTKMLAVTTPASKAGSKDTSATMGNPMIPMSSPLWSISTPRDKLPSSTLHRSPIVDFQSKVTPLHSYQTPPIRSFVGHTNWPSQTCFPSPWLASPQTATFSPNVRFEPVTMTETVKLTPVKDTTLQPASGMKHMTSSAAVNNVGPNPIYRGVTPLNESKLISSPELLSGDSRSRKRKKVPSSDPVQPSSVSDGQLAPVLVPNVDSLQALPVSTASISTPPNAVLSKPVGVGSTVMSRDHSKYSELESSKMISCSEETLSNVTEAKTQAEDAANLATAAVSHCEDLWAKLAEQEEAGLTSEAEANLVSAAAAIAAAASVAKAAAAAALIARNAALQAKLMADEAVFSDKSGDMVPSSGGSIKHNSGVVNDTPASIFKDVKISAQSSTILVAAKEAAKRRVEAASAASKQAVNLDAIVKAAELAAAAVSQAGKLVSMGKPLPLNDLIEAGPEGFWKLPQSPAKLAEKLGDGVEEQSCIAVSKLGTNVPAKAVEKELVVRGGTRKTGHNKINPSEKLKDMGGQMSLSAPILGFMQTDNLEIRTGTDGKASETDITQTTNNVQNKHDELAGTLRDDSIKEGSPVEVFKCGDGLKSAWYSANVLSLEDGKAYICYSDLSADEGSESLCEWIPLEGEGDKAPIIRLVHPMTAVQYQGTRKRRRAALGDYSWCVEDRVDVWIDDCWWEGVVTEKNEKDETTLKVHFPAQGETLTVRAWNLRTSRSWIDGKWVEWSSLKAHNPSEQSDTPQEKRRKLGSSPALTVKQTDKLPNDADLAFGKSEASKFVSLSTSERTFDIGKTTKDNNKHAARRPLKTGQLKEGSRVVFGVPKPTGKKRKFMEVSKQFPANKGDKSNEVSDPVKSTKSSMAQGTGSRGWKASSRNDSKEKRTVEPKPRVPNTRVAFCTMLQKGNPRSRLGQNREDNGTDPGSDVEDSVGHDDSMLEKMVGHDGANDEPAEAPLASLLQHTFASSKKTSSSNIRSERLTRGKLAPSGGKLSKIKEDRVYRDNSSKVVSDVSEPRRSNRRINPTHRLLEGLQTSMMIPKMPPVSYDKGNRSQSKNVLTRGK